LAGIFDAEGSYSDGILRISNTDPAIIGHICEALRRSAFRFAIERTQLFRPPVIAGSQFHLDL
jgi:hypothetical protein